MYANAFAQGISFVLMQHDKAITYACRQLKPCERNYPIRDLELATVDFVKKNLRHYLCGVSMIFTYPKSLSSIFHREN